MVVAASRSQCVSFCRWLKLKLFPKAVAFSCYCHLIFTLSTSIRTTTTIPHVKRQHRTFNKKCSQFMCALHQDAITSIILSQKSPAAAQYRSLYRISHQPTITTSCLLVSVNFCQLQSLNLLLFPRSYSNRLPLFLNLYGMHSTKRSLSMQSLGLARLHIFSNTFNIDCSHTFINTSNINCSHTFSNTSNIYFSADSSSISMQSMPENLKAKYSENIAWRRFLAISSLWDNRLNSSSHSPHDQESLHMSTLYEIYDVFAKGASPGYINELRLAHIKKFFDKHRIPLSKQLSHSIPSSIDHTLPADSQATDRFHTLYNNSRDIPKIESEILINTIRSIVKDYAAFGQTSQSELSTLVSDHLSRGSVFIAAEILQNMRSKGISLDPSAAHSIFTALDSSQADSFIPYHLDSLHTSVTEYQQETSKSNPQVADALNLLKTYCSSSSTFSKAKSLFEKLPFAELNSATAILKSHAFMIDSIALFKQDLEFAEQIFNDVSFKYKLVPDMDVYRSMLHAYVVLGSLEQVHAFRDTLVQAGIRFDHYIYNLLIRAHADREDGAGAVAFLNMAESEGIIPTIGMLTSTLLAYVRSADDNAMRLAESFFYQRIQGKHHYGVQVFNILMDGYSRRKLLYPMMFWFEQLLLHNCRPDEFTYSIFKYVVFSNSPDISDTMRDNFDQNFEKQSGISVLKLRSIYSETIEFKYRLHAIGMSDGLDWFEKNIQGTSYAPTLVTYTILMALHIRNSNHKAALRVYNMILSCGFKLDEHVYHQLIQAGLLSTNWYMKAFDCFEKMIAERLQPLRVTVVSLLRICIKHRLTEQLERVVSITFIRNPISYELSFYMLVFEILVRANNWNSATDAICIILRQILTRQRGPKTAVIQPLLVKAVTWSNADVVFMMGQVIVQTRILLQKIPALDILNAMNTMLIHSSSLPLHSYDASQSNSSLELTQDNDRSVMMRPSLLSSFNTLPIAQSHVHSMAEFILYTMLFPTQIQPTHIKSLLQNLADQKLFQIIHDLSILVLTPDVSTMGYPTQQEVKDYQAGCDRFVGNTLQILSLAHGCEKLTRSLWERIVTSNIADSSINQSKPSVSLLLSRQGTTPAWRYTPTDQIVWKYFQILVKWKQVDEALEMVTNGLEQMRFPPSEKLFKLVRNWFEAEGLHAQGKCYIDFWKLKWPEWVL
ncbi:hypothetical protein O5D80_008239 [Batrachochytrium dendrobatidis]|nr:hypothetical protein O5D80_008239 [Batrachochytrium dendrobatidis]